MTNLLVPLADAGPLGGKAGLLARLIAGGLPVPDGVVVTPAALAAVAGVDGAIPLDTIGARLAELGRAVDEAEIPAGLADAVADAARRLAPLAVRSSGSIEDRAAAAGAGVLASRVDVAADDVWPAVRAVWASAIAPLAIAYARARGTAAIEVAVIVQRFEPGRRVTIYTRPPGHPDADEVWVESAGAPARRLARGADDATVRLALDAERAIGAAAGADVELVVGATRTWVVQARPIVHPPARAGATPPPRIVLAFSAATPGVTWRRDAVHNPDPMSPAQAGLVAAVVRAGASPWRMEVAGGYLYVADEPTSDIEPLFSDDDDGLGAVDLRGRFDVICGRLEAAIAATPPDLAAAIEAYTRAFAVYARELTPLVARARRRLPALLARNVSRADAEALAARLAPRRPGALDTLLVDAARGVIDEELLLSRVADHAPAWDVAVPTFGEQPDRVYAAVDRLRGALDALTPAAPLPVDVVATATGIPAPALAAAVAYAIEAAALAEEDDARFARAQAMVRRALLAAGRRLGLDDPEDACWLPLDEVAAAERGDGPALDPIAARARASAARAAAARARGWAMPPVVRDGADASLPAVGVEDVWRGAGTGPRVSGTAHRIDDLARAALVPAGAIAIVPTVTPALALVLAGARAIVSEHGGVLDHGAAIARELGVPCVVGARGAWRDLADGELIEVDGDAGIVRRVR